MVWRQAETGVWIDDVDGAEKVFYGMSQAFKGLGKEHGSVYAVCKLGVKDTISQSSLERLLRDAWRVLRFDFPALTVVVDDSGKKYVEATPENIEKWMQETFAVTTILSAGELIPNMHLRKLPCLIYLPESSEVIFHCSHWRIDALGTCMVLNRLFDLISEETAGCIPKWQNEYENLSPSLEDAYGSPSVYSAAAQETAGVICRRNFATSYPYAGLPYNGDATTLPTRSWSQATTLTASATNTLIAACKSHNISITAAVHAACAEAVFDRSSEPHPNYSTVVSVNIRDYLPQPDDGPKPAYVCGTYVTGITHTLRRSDDFPARAAQLTHGYKGNWDIDEYLTALRPIYKLHGERLAAMAKSGTRAPASNVTVSSLGIIENHLARNHGCVVVEKFRFGSQIMTRQPTLYIWTFGGRLTLSVDYNEAYYGEEAIAGLLASIWACLERELEVVLERCGDV